MAKIIQDRILDFGLTDLHNNADKIYIVSADPADFTSATSTSALGNKSFGAGNAVGNPAAGTGGRKVTTSAISDGSVTATGTAAGWAIVDSVNARLLVNGGLNASQAVTVGNTFTLGAFDILMKNS
jgi:hypothetical protein